jgi:hypothetical protein
MQPLPAPRPSTLTLLGAIVVVVAACTIATPTAPPNEPGPSTAPGVATPLATPDVTAVAEDAVFGQWRRAPAHPTPAIAQAAEAACREQGAVGTLPLVVLDARGEGEITVVFADPKAAALCHAKIAEDGSATADARKVRGYPDAAPASQKLGIHDLESIDDTTGARTVLVGRVGPDVARVAAQFDDATWSNATMAGGWYAMWWPGRDPVLTVAAVSSRSEALDGFSP